MTSEPVCRPTSRSVRVIWVLLGSIALGIGIIGIPLPILPTTPFLLAAAYCYARGSRRAHEWLLRNRLLGAFIVSGEVGMPRWFRLIMILFVWAACIISLWLFARDQWQQMAVLLVGIIMTVYLILVPGAPRKDTSALIGDDNASAGDERRP